VPSKRRAGKIVASVPQVPVRDDVASAPAPTRFDRLIARLRKLRIAIAAVAGVGAVIGGLAGYWNAYQAARGSMQPSLLSIASGSPVDAKSIAVLPFVDMSERRDQEYLSDGLTEEMIDHLSRAEDLKVIARTSSFQFKGKNEDIRSIANKLGVAHVLEGSVRRAASEVRITVQLIRAGDGTHIWSKTFDRNHGDIFRMQEEIASTVAQALHVALDLGGPKGSVRRPNLQAHNLVLEGDFIMKRKTKADNKHAIQLYREAIGLDADYALPWVRIGLAHIESAYLAWGSVSEDIASARAAIDEALRIDPNLAAAHAALGKHLFSFNWDWQGSKAACRRARELNGGSGDPYCERMVLPFGRMEESIAVGRTQLARDPLSTYALEHLAYILYFSGRYADAAAAYQKLLDLNPSNGGAKAYLAATLLYQGKMPEALSAAEQEPDAGWRSAILPIVYWELGRRSDSDSALSHLANTYAEGMAYNVAEAHAYRGEVDAAFAWLDRAYRLRDPGMLFLKVDPMLDKLRSDARYQAFLVKMKLDGDPFGPPR